MGKVVRKDIPARTPKGRENQLINLAIDLAEKQLKDGSATSQVITHFLRLATERERLENDKLRSQLKLDEAKIQSLKSQETIEKLYTSALAAMRGYSGEEDENSEEQY